MNRPWILGINASHNGSVCLLHGDEIVVAIQEERLSRRKRERVIGTKSIMSLMYCLTSANIDITQVDLVVCATQGTRTDPNARLEENPMFKGRNGPKIVNISHHLGHALSTYALSTFSHASILVIDGMGSSESEFSKDEKEAIIAPVVDAWETISLFRANGSSVTALEKHVVPRRRWLVRNGRGMPRFFSLGAIFSAVAEQIFGDAMDAGKVMGLAPYGECRFPRSEFFEITDGVFRYSDTIPLQFPHAVRWPCNLDIYRDLAKSAQCALEYGIHYLLKRLKGMDVSETNLCYAGGVALNAIANENQVYCGPFPRIEIAPAAEDSGVALGAAFHGLWSIWPRRVFTCIPFDSLGRSYSEGECCSAVRGFPGLRLHKPDDILSDVVQLLISGRIVGWFEGGAELGPRALGKRSVLCDPRSATAKNVLNTKVKFRESFRPFAPIIPLSEIDAWFESSSDDMDSPFMLRVMKFRPEQRVKVPAVVHVDGTGRVQTLTAARNGRLFDLVRKFGEVTGVPVLLNTSMNVMGEPIVESPEDALDFLYFTGCDGLVLESLLVTKRPDWTGRSILECIPRVRDIVLTPSLGTTDSYSCAVNTPYGRVDYPLPADIVSIIHKINGMWSGYEILEELREGGVSADTLGRILGNLKRADIIQFLARGEDMHSSAVPCFGG